ncbi:MAG: DUF4832 domain-containing protein [Anaerocolumna sp.]
MKKLVTICLFIFIIVMGVIWIKYTREIKQRITLELDYRDSAKSIQNPERGWYLIYRCMVNNNAEEGKEYIDRFKEQYEAGDALVLLMFNLYGYRDGDISRKGLLYIKNVLDGIRQTGLKAIVRFVYDWDGSGLDNEPEDIGLILNHMEQLKEQLISYQDIIYLIQGIFAGSYGEMNSSKYLGTKDLNSLLDKLIECTPQNTKLSVRTPDYWRIFCGQVNPVSAFSQLPGAKIGLYNDGLCSSDSDLGTYSDGTGILDWSYANKWMRTEELEFQAELCRFVPNGGEVAVESEYNDLDNILKEFPMLHISYLNKDYNMDVLDKWKASVYSAVKEDDPYDKVNGYQYIQDHLGYRFVLRKVSVPKRIFLNTASSLQIEIENTGFANIYYPKEMLLIFSGLNTGKEVTIPIKPDIRLWNSGEITKLDLPVPVNKLMEDTYKVYIKITGDNGKAIQMANPDIFDNSKNANAVGTIDIHKFSLKNLLK